MLFSTRSEPFPREEPPSGTVLCAQPLAGTGTGHDRTVLQSSRAGIDWNGIGVSGADLRGDEPGEVDFGEMGEAFEGCQAEDERGVGDAEWLYRQGGVAKAAEAAAAAVVVVFMIRWIRREMMGAGVVQGWVRFGGDDAMVTGAAGMCMETTHRHGKHDEEKNQRNEPKG